MHHSLFKMRSNFNSKNSYLGPTAAEPRVEDRSIAPLKQTPPIVKLPEPTLRPGKIDYLNIYI